MTSRYTEEKLSSMEKETIIQLFLAQQEQLENIDKNLQLVLEQLADQKRHRFGRSSERHVTEGQISFMEVDGEIVFFNEPEAVADQETEGETQEAPGRRTPKKKKGKRKEDLDGLPVIKIEHTMTEEQLSATFGEKGYKRLPDEVYHRYKFTPAKVEVEEHHVAVYAGKADDDTIVRAGHPGCLLQGSLVSPSMEAAIINAKYVNACPLYRQEKEFERYGIKVSRQNMAYWTIQCADRYLAVLYDYLHEKMYGYHVLQADETGTLIIFIVCVIILPVYYQKGIYPFGDGTIAYGDMAQTIPIQIFYMWDILHGKANPFFHGIQDLELILQNVRPKILF